jgi:hypothetical protein
MAAPRQQKRNRGETRKASPARRPTRKKAEEKRIEELGPEQRAELAQQIEAKRFRGRPPSI